jgi:type II secretory pathway pseudopilin PulG
MPHPQYDDADDPRPLAPKRSRKGVVGIATLVGLLALVAAAVALGAVRAMQARDREAEAQAVAAGKMAQVVEARARKTWTRDGFRASVLGRTPGEVRMLVAPPLIEGTENGLTAWHYPGRTTDPATGNPDADAVVVFKDDLAATVRFEPAAQGREN